MQNRIHIFLFSFLAILICVSSLVFARAQPSSFGEVPLKGGRGQIASIELLSGTLAVDWAQPEVGCVEDLVPNVPDRACLDLTTVANPMKDWPALAPAELVYWQTTKRPLNYCRAQEVLRREAAAPGSQVDFLETAWMYDLAAKNYDAKVSAIYEASRNLQIPAQILTGALYQESLLSELGIAEDGGNFSCGIGQANLSEWCNWIDKQSPSVKALLGWPSVSCSEVSPSLLRPFYRIAVKNLAGAPEYQLSKAHFANIAFDDVVADFPSGNAVTQRARYRAVSSFIEHCSEPVPGISANANAIAQIYRSVVPKGLLTRETYTAGEKFNRSCREQGFEGQYPLNSGWLIAVGIYNAGGKGVDALAHYNRWSATNLADEKTFANFSPPDLVEAFYWAGQYESRDDQIHFKRLDGRATNWLWYKACVLQRHIARVVQHVSLPGVPNLISSLEGKAGCAKSIFDASGKLVQSKVPPERQISSGVK